VTSERANDDASGKLVDASLQRFRDLGPWIACLAGPTAALGQVTFGLALVPAARGLGGKTLLYALTLLMLGVTVAAALACLRDLRRARTLPADATSTERARFIAQAGLLINLFSAVVIVAQALPIAMLELD
jgi:hypothetical protein